MKNINSKASPFITNSWFLMLLVFLVLVSLLSAYFLFLPRDSKNLLPWKLGGECANGYHVSDLKKHPEFLRLTCSKGDISHSVEVVPSRKCLKCVQTDYYLIQPAPGKDVPPEFIKEIQTTLIDWEKSLGHVPFVSDTHFIQEDENASEDYNDLVVNKLHVISSNPQYAWFSTSLIFLITILLGLLPKSVMPTFFIQMFSRCSRFMDFLVVPIISYIELRTRKQTLKSDKLEPISLKKHILYMSIVGFVTYLYLNVLWGLFFSWDVAIDKDTIRDFMMAKDCLSGTHCHFSGPSSGFIGHHGSLWIHFLVVTQWLGFNMLQIQQILFLGFSAAATILFEIIWRLKSLTASLFGLCIFISVGLFMIDIPEMQNSTFTPLPFMLFLLSLYLLLQNGSRKAILVTSLLAAICVDIHLKFLFCLPFVFFLVAYRARNSIFGVVLSIATILCFWFLSSHDAAVSCYHDMIEHNFFIPFILVHVLAISFGLRCRIHSQQITWHLHPSFVLLFFSALQIFIISVALLVVDHPLSAYYYFSALPGLCLIGGIIYEKFIHQRFWRVQFVTVAIVLFLMSVLFLNHIFSTYMVTQRFGWLIQQYFQDNDLEYLKIFNNVHLGPIGKEREILKSVILFSPDVPDSLSSGLLQSNDYYFLLANNNELPKTNTNVKTIGQYFNQPLLVWTLPAWIEKNGTRVKYQTTNKQGETITVEEETEIFSNNIHKCLNNGKYVWQCINRKKIMNFIDTSDAPTSNIHYTFKIAVGNDKARMFCTPPLYSSQVRPWQIVKVKGLDYKGELPTHSVIIKAGKVMEGEITISLDMSIAGNKSLPFEFPPTILEISPDDSWLCPLEN